MAEFDLSKLMQDVSKSDTGRDKITYLAYGDISPDADNGYSMTGIDDLARSIEIGGLQQPLRVRQIEGDHGHYQIVSGHRRHAAIGMLIQQGSELFTDGVPCIIDTSNVSAAFRELQLLLGNADNRKLTAADEAQQAERISDCLRKLEDEGFVFPGRHRDWVAKLSGMSRTKLARLSAIKNNLVPELLCFFSSGQLNESVAYGLQQLPVDIQNVIAKSCKRSGNIDFITVDAVTYCLKNADRFMQPSKCGNGDECDHHEQRFLQSLRSQYAILRCDGGCCLSCGSLSSCKYACSKGRNKRSEDNFREQSKLAKSKAKAEREDAKRQSEYRHAIQSEANRVLPLIEAAGLDDKTKLQGRFSYNTIKVSEIKKYAAGDFGDLHFYNNSFLPSEANGLKEWAETLDCSIDFLVGLTNEPHPVASSVESISSIPDNAIETIPARPIVHWERGMNDLPIDRPLLTWSLSNAGEVYRVAVWTGSRFVAPGNPRKELTGLYFTRWMEIPDESDCVVPPVPEAQWQTGNPSSEGRYICRIMFGSDSPCEQICDWRAERWYVYGNQVGDMFTVIGWWPIPQRDSLAETETEKEDD